MFGSVNFSEDAYSTPTDFSYPYVRPNLRRPLWRIPIVTLRKPDFGEALEKWVSLSDGTPMWAKKIAESRIQACLENREKTLYLGSLGLCSIPPLFDLVWLKELSLFGNQLKSVPQDSFSCLTNLQKLDLSYNHLMVLEESCICFCKKLKELNLSYNHFFRFESLPVFSFFSNLRILHLNNNEFVSFEGFDVSECLVLNRLDLSWNKFESLEKLNLSSCTKLQYLNLGFNCLTRCDGLLVGGLFSDLHTICLENNVIENLDGFDLSRSTGLRRIKLSNNRLRDISGLDLSGCFELSALHLEFNQLTEINCILPHQLRDKVKLFLRGNLM